MILIAHRGNLNGPSQDENSPEKILTAILRGFDVEIDVWYQDGVFYLGHDKPQYEVNLNFLKNNKVWCHAKNTEALEKLLESEINCFWHQTDDCVLTSNGFMWTYPDKNLTKKSICVMPEITQYNLHDIKKCAGICTDYPERYKNDLQL